MFLVLGIRRDDSTFKDVARAYRKLALQWHPDRHKGEEAKNIATEKFRLIAAAYEVLRDEESRKDYDYMLDNPEEMYHHYYRYYRRMYAPKVDVRIVLVVTISLISAYQYYAYNSRFNEAIDYFVTVPKYRMKAQQIATEEGIWPMTATTSDGKTRLKQRGPNKQNVKQILKNEEEAVIRKVVEEMMDIKGAYSKPTYKDLLWVQLFLLPVYIGEFCNVFQCTQLIRFCSSIFLFSPSMDLQVLHSQRRVWLGREALSHTQVHGTQRKPMGAKRRS